MALLAVAAFASLHAAPDPGGDGAAAAQGAAAQGAEAPPLPGATGTWLRNGAAEAYVSATPYPRVLAFRLRGGTSPLFVTPDFGLIGIRGRYYEADLPKGTPDSSMAPAEQPAVLSLPDPANPLAVRLTAAPDPDASGLQYSLDVTLDPVRAELVLVHRFLNLRQTPRRLAPWAIVAVPGRGVGLLPIRQSTVERRLITFPGLSQTQPGVDLGASAIAVDYATPPKQVWYKIGTDADADWVAYTVDGLVLRSAVAHDPAGEYPESGASVTIFKWRGGAAWQALPFGEIEHNGVWRTVAPSATMELRQTVTLAPLPTDPPPPTALDADAWLPLLAPPPATEDAPAP